MRNVYADALLCQDACNLSGVTHSLSQHLTESIWPEVRANGGGTDDVNRHPAVILFVSKLCHLAGMQQDFDEFSKAYDICLAKSKENVE